MTDVSVSARYWLLFRRRGGGTAIVIPLCAPVGDGEHWVTNDAEALSMARCAWVEIATEERQLAGVLLAMCDRFMVVATHDQRITLPSSGSVTNYDLSAFTPETYREVCPLTGVPTYGIPREMEDEVALVNEFDHGDIDFFDPAEVVSSMYSCLARHDYVYGGLTGAGGRDRFQEIADRAITRLIDSTVWTNEMLKSAPDSVKDTNDFHYAISEAHYTNMLAVSARRKVESTLAYLQEPLLVQDMLQGDEAAQINWDDIDWSETGS